MQEVQIPPSPADAFREHPLRIMDRKHHWAWPHFAGPSVTKEQLRVHFRQEYAVYVRDFPVFLAKIYANNPPPEARSLLAENIYEEDTGRLSLGRSHPDLFMTMMKGLGYARSDFLTIDLLPKSLAYRTWLDHIAGQPNWVVGAAALTILVEGSIHDRKELRQPAKTKTPGDIEDVVTKHPLVIYHGLAPENLDLIRAHQMVEADHRQAAYAMVTRYATTHKDQEKVVNCLEDGLRLWLEYRDGVAEACGLHPLSSEAAPSP